jgi:hypothetical protein
MIDDSAAHNILTRLADESPGCDKETEYIQPEVQVDNHEVLTAIGVVRADLAYAISLLETFEEEPVVEGVEAVEDVVLEQSSITTAIVKSTKRAKSND